MPNWLCFDYAEKSIDYIVLFLLQLKRDYLVHSDLVLHWLFVTLTLGLFLSVLVLYYNIVPPPFLLIKFILVLVFICLHSIMFLFNYWLFWHCSISSLQLIYAELELLFIWLFSFICFYSIFAFGTSTLTISTIPYIVYPSYSRSLATLAKSAFSVSTDGYIVYGFEST